MEGREGLGSSPTIRSLPSSSIVVSSTNGFDNRRGEGPPLEGDSPATVGNIPSIGAKRDRIVHNRRRLMRTWPRLRGPRPRVGRTSHRSGRRPPPRGAACPLSRIISQDGEKVPADGALLVLNWGSRRSHRGRVPHDRGETGPHVDDRHRQEEQGDRVGDRPPPLTTAPNPEMSTRSGCGPGGPRRSRPPLGFLRRPRCRCQARAGLTATR